MSQVLFSCSEFLLWQYDISSFKCSVLAWSIYTHNGSPNDDKHSTSALERRFSGHLYANIVFGSSDMEDNSIFITRIQECEDRFHIDICNRQVSYKVKYSILKVFSQSQSYSFIPLYVMK